MNLSGQAGSGPDDHVLVLEDERFVDLAEPVEAQHVVADVQTVTI